MLGCGKTGTTIAKSTQAGPVTFDGKTMNDYDRNYYDGDGCPVCGYANCVCEDEDWDGDEDEFCF